MQQTRPVNGGIDLNKIAAIGEKLRTLVDELSMIFPERRHLIYQILYALLTKEHVLVFGPYGTGKSDLLHTLFKVFTNARIFSIALSKFMTEGNIIGLPDPKLMREKGEFHYRRDGGILDADFVELDELLDANWPLLRVLLGILNERQFKRGRQIEDAKLHTAVACTNADTEEAIRKQQELGAVIDRFLFHCKVSYLKSEESRRRMYQKFLSGEVPSVQIDLKELQCISDIIVDANQITDPYFIEVYDKIIEEYCKKSNSQIVSDRRKCKLLQLIEANALLYGRYEVVFEDIWAARWGLCMGNDTGQHDLFKSIAQPIIEEAVKKSRQNIDGLQKKLLAELKAKIPEIPKQAGSDELVELSRLLKRLKKEVEDVKPQLASTEDEKRQILKIIEPCMADVLAKITG